MTLGVDHAESRRSRVWASLVGELNFFRIHLVAFIATPLVVSSIIYGANTVNRISYIDSLFLAVSALTTTGLATVDLSVLNGFQQACLFASFVCGSMAFVSGLMLVVRQHYFRKAFVQELHVRRSAPRSRRLSARLGLSRDCRTPGEQTAALEIRLDGLHDRDAKANASAPEPPEDLDAPVGSAGINSLPGNGQSLQLQPLGKSYSIDVSTLRARKRSLEIPRTYTTMSSRTGPVKNSGLGGFPMPMELAGTISRRLFPDTVKSFRHFLDGGDSDDADDAGHANQQEERFTRIPFEVGRNSNFQHLTWDQRKELGGVEYRASRLLLIIVYSYVVLIPLIAFTVIGPYISVGGRWEGFLESQHRPVAALWFAAFNVWSAFTNCGLSLSDTSMIPFQTAYPLVIITTFLIFMGNTAFPICLRGTIWTLHAVAPRNSDIQQSLAFLLDHPRRCFPYLFPAKQTWYLASVLLVLTSIDFVAFMVLDIGNEVIDAIPVGTRIVAGIMQAAAVRVEGFSIVPLAGLVPAVQVLFVVMMYVAVLPLALTVRSTNVYEEQALGIYQDNGYNELEHAPKRTANYLVWHVRRQLSFDLWWLALALWVICIIERDHIMDTLMNPWFNVFSILFETISAYGTVGLSLGSPTSNFSLSGNFHPLSKLIIMAVMLRGRHRGLPFAIDRAVMLPASINEAEAGDDDAGEAP